MRLFPYQRITKYDEQHNKSFKFVRFDYDVNKSNSLTVVDGPFDELNGQWSFKTIDRNNTHVTLEIDYKFKNSLIEISIEPIFSTIMNSILKSFIDQAFKIKYND